uniref:Pentatricopeptide repeat-containing protein n=1 Tax=Chenopodium quinoa TaxID=63459 RepID=A0A803MB00_CHEQI
MRNHGFPYLRLGNKLINAYLKLGNLVYAHQLFDKLPQRHVAAWNAMISCYIRQKRNPEAVESSWESSCFGVGGFKYVCQLGQMKNAHLVADRVVEKDVILFTSLVVGYVQNGEDCEAMKAFNQMIKEGVKANEYTFTSLLVYDGLFDRDLVLVNTMMYAYAQNGFEYKTLELLQQPNDLGLEPNGVTYPRGEVHTFMAGNWSQPSFKETDYIIKELMKKVKELGDAKNILDEKLYPGKYEIKFIVDGVWQVDLLRDSKQQWVREQSSYDSLKLRIERPRIAICLRIRDFY